MAGGISSHPKTLLAHLIEATSRAVVAGAPRKLVERLSKAAADLTYDLATGQPVEVGVKAAQRALAAYHHWTGVH